MKQLTERQRNVLDMIEQFQQDFGYPPTRVEIAEHFGFKSSNAAEEYVKALVKKGYITRIQGQSRGIQLVKKRKSGLPVISHITPGKPILSNAHIDEHLNIKGNTFSPNAHFFIRVSDNCFADAGILPGDLLAIHRTTEAKNGEIIIGRLNQDMILKRFKKARTKIILASDVANQEPLQLTAKESKGLFIEGKAVGVIKQSL